MKFNQEKCKHLHIGKDSSIINNYQLFGKDVIKDTTEKDLGIHIDNKLSFKEHINLKAKKANKVLGLIKRSFNYIYEPMFLILYKSLIRPQLEYGSNVWSVIYKKEEAKLENVQRRATKILKCLKDKDYNQRLKHLGLPSLEYRRQRSDLIQVYKIIKNIDRVDKNKLFPSSRTQNTTRGHDFKIYKKTCRTNLRKFSFSQRIVNPWNNLPRDIVNSDNVNSFKNSLNKFWKNNPVKFSPECYRPEAGNTCPNKEEKDLRSTCL